MKKFTRQISQFHAYQAYLAGHITKPLYDIILMNETPGNATVAVFQRATDDETMARSVAKLWFVKSPNVVYDHPHLVGLLRAVMDAPGPPIEELATRLRPRETKFNVGDKVRALEQIVEDGSTRGNPDAKFPEHEYIHAEEDELGVIVGVDDGMAMVRFDRTGTATVVADTEIELVKQ